MASLPWSNAPGSSARHPAPTRAAPRLPRLAGSSFLAHKLETLMASGRTQNQRACQPRLTLGVPIRAGPEAAVKEAATSQKVEKTFTLSDGSTLDVTATGATDHARASIVLELHGGLLAQIDSLIAHWGATTSDKSGWVLPGLQPDGTRRYKNRALQTPFKKSGERQVLRIEIADPSYTGIEFTLKDDALNAWYNFNDTNFRVDIPASQVQQDPAMIVIPETLVQVQAYLRWERKGKQSYSQEQEKEEYEGARRELQEAVAGGASIRELEMKLLGGGSSQKQTNGTVAAKSNGVATAPPPPPPPPPQAAAPKAAAPAPAPAPAPAKVEEAVYVPEDLVAVQAYIRWEKNGKQNYSPEQQLAEYSEAKKELEREVRNGLSVAELRKRLTGGSGATAPTAPPPKPQTVERTARKFWNPEEYIRKYRATDEGASAVLEAPKKGESEGLTALDMGALVVEGAHAGDVVAKKKFGLSGEHSIVVLVLDKDGEMRVTLASDYPQPLVLHWGLSKSRNDGWQAPPDALCYTGLERACESEFEPGFAGDSTLQSLTVELGGLEKEYPGLPFVLRSGETWMKDKGRDFFVSLNLGQHALPVDLADGTGAAKPVLDEIASVEDDAERSLMHRFNLGTDVLERAKEYGRLGLAAVFVWFRFMASRQLVWNKNYNVKPREISAAQDRFTNLLEEVYASKPEFREMTRMILMTVGRGGEGDVGQRIRDEILVIQRHNDCKGGMMEEWHQKLHNNTSPDDVVICQALIDYIRSDFNIDVYWKVLNANGVTRERLLSYDKAIHSEPRFVASQKDGLLRDLGNYLKSLKAVHSGADLESAVAKCMGYKQGAKAEFMGTIEVHPIRGLSPRLPSLLQFTLEHVEDRNVVSLMEGLLEARQELRPSLKRGQERLKDVIFLDLALDSTLRTAAERGMGNARSAEDIMNMACLLVENVALSADDNEELVYCLKSWYKVLEQTKQQQNSGNTEWALLAKSVLDRTRLCLAAKAEQLQHTLQPSARYLGAKLGVPSWAVDIFTEEVIRGNSAATLSILLNRLDPVLRKAADMGSWQVISPSTVRGFIECVAEMHLVQEKVYERPTVLVAGRVKGEEEIPDGVVALFTPDMPDVLSHVSVRARNSRVCFATCFDEGILASLRAKNGQSVLVTPKESADGVDILDISEADVIPGGSSGADSSDPPPNLKINRKQFAGKFAVTAEEFNPELVGAKSRNIAGLQGKLPEWIKLPTSVALPFGSFEETLNDPMNQGVKAEVQALEKELEGGDFSKLAAIRKFIPQLQPPAKLKVELEKAMRASGMPFPGDESSERWSQAWNAITKVWASKWNERAFVSMRKARLNFSDLCMAVLVQEIVQADYAYVIHTTNPSTNDNSEIYAEVVRGLGETLVGAYPGRALSFSAKKGHSDQPKVLGFPSKEVGLFIQQSIIFRSDSNGEDLEGYAGAGLYDSVPMDKEEEKVVDYSSDPMVVDPSFRRTILAKIAAAGEEIERVLGSPQDIEGVVKNGEIYVVQTRPQM